MSYFQIIGFRGTAGYVSDIANMDHELSTTADYPKVTAQGNTVGWVSTPPSFALDRAAGNDARLAGIAYCNNNGVNNATFEFDLPSAGTYKIGVAMGDPSYSLTSQGISVYDNTSLLSQLFTGKSTGAANSFIDATGTVYTHTAWPGSNTTVSLTFASTKCIFKVDTGNQRIACLYVQAVAAATQVYVESERHPPQPRPAHRTLLADEFTFTPSVPIGPDESRLPPRLPWHGAPAADEAVFIPPAPTQFYPDDDHHPPQGRLWHRTLYPEDKIFFVPPPQVYLDDEHPRPQARPFHRAADVDEGSWPFTTMVPATVIVADDYQLPPKPRPYHRAPDVDQGGWPFTRSERLAVGFDDYHSLPPRRPWHHTLLEGEVVVGTLPTPSLFRAYGQVSARQVS